MPIRMRMRMRLVVSRMQDLYIIFQVLSNIGSLIAPQLYLSDLEAPVWVR